MEEVLFQEETRNTLLPIKYHKIFENYKKQAASFWQVHEVEAQLAQDKIDFNVLSDEEKYFIKMVLAFFASSDLIVNENLAQKFTQEIKIREIVIAYDYQKMMENIHTEMYSILIDTYISDKKEKNYY
jgi:ribonucleoside-diphosphate reductase beta chain